MTTDSERYQARKAQFDGMLTIYGRKPVLEALQNDALAIHKLHIADSNKPATIIEQIRSLAEQRQIEVQYLSRDALARISKNKKQDQGVAADLILERYTTLDKLLSQGTLAKANMLRLLAIDGVNNPQNLGMIIRSAAAGNIDYLIIPRQGCAQIESLVIKASAGTVFKCPIVRCERIEEAINAAKQRDITVSILDANGDYSAFEAPEKPRLLILGNETSGLSTASKNAADETLFIPMQNGVESLNVAVTAALLAYLPQLSKRP